MRVPVADPGRGNHSLGAILESSIARVVASGRYVLGPEVGGFESELADYVGATHCVGVASGTDALELCLRAVGCQAGDELVTVANAGFYASAAALAVGMDVRYADIDEQTLLLTAETLEPVLTPATRAVVVTHLYGALADVELLARLCRERGVALVEDCAQALGAHRNGRHAGTFGDAAAFSFYPTKNLGALGDAGAIVTSDEEIATRARKLRQYGWERKYVVMLPYGRNSRLDELQAAVLRAKLPVLDEWNARRRQIVARYAGALAPSAGRLVSEGGEADVAHLAVALMADREAARAHLGARSIGTDVHYPVADHSQPLLHGRATHPPVPVTEHAVAHVLTLPCFPELDDVEVEYVCEALRDL